jgi:hypothetical protein
MKYSIEPWGNLAWTVLVESEEDIKEYIVNFNIFSNEFICHCIWNVLTDKECRHVLFVKRFITTGVKEYVEE